MPPNLRCRVITPQGVVLDRQSPSVRLPAHDGSVGVLAGHAPTVWLLARGTLMIRTRLDSKLFMELEEGGGFAEVRDDVLTVLVERAGPVRGGGGGGSSGLRATD